MMNFSVKVWNEYELKEEFKDYIITFEYLKSINFKDMKSDEILFSQLAKNCKLNLNENFDYKEITFQKYISSYLIKNKKQILIRNEIKNNFKDDSIIKETNR
jgi:hypothetical protein